MLFRSKGTSYCSWCNHNELSKETENAQDHHITPLEKVNEFYEFLTDSDTPEGVHAESPKLAYELAFTVIWFLQEITHCLPEHIEQCKECFDLFDSDREGCCLDDQYNLDGKTLPEKYWGYYCDNCVPNIEFMLA